MLEYIHDLTFHTVLTSAFIIILLAATVTMNFHCGDVNIIEFLAGKF
jgi:hypothetical protein